MLRQEVAIGSLGRDIPDTALLEGERRILARVAKGGPLTDVLRDLILLIEQPSQGEMLASILVLSEDGARLLEGAAPSLPAAYNAAINGIPVGNGIGSCGTDQLAARPWSRARPRKSFHSGSVAISAT